MKNLKLALLSIFLIALSFTSCTNDEPVIEPQNIEDSQSITTSLAQLKTQFNSEGNITPTNNTTIKLNVKILILLRRFLEIVPVLSGILA